MSRKLTFCLIVVVGALALCAQAQQFLSLSNAPTAVRFPLTDRVWDVNPGDASICLWEDDKFAAMSFTIDDFSAANVAWWLDKSATYGGFKISWFVVTERFLPGGSSGSWDQVPPLLAMGHDVQSHSVTHENGDAEYADSQADIEAGVPGHVCDFLAYPGGSTYPPDRVAAAKYYASARGTQAIINQANKIDYFMVCATSVGGQTNNPAKPWTYLPSLYNAADLRYYRGWIISIDHISTLLADRIEMFEFFRDHQDDLWGGTYGNIAKYGQERDTATLTVTSNTASRITMTLSDQMLDSRFDYPLTIKVRLPDVWASAFATQNGAETDVSVITYNGAKYALVKAVPDRGIIELTPSAAGFTASPKSGWAPLNVTFTDNVTGTVARIWDFGDGATSNTTEQVVQHTYSSTGSYTVVLVSGGETNSQANCVTVTAPVAPSAGFTLSPASGEIPLTAAFTDTSTGDITNRFWDFGDGSTTNTIASGVFHTYTNTGAYTVGLTVSGPAGTSVKIQTNAVTASAPVPPVASFSANPVSGSAPLTVTFTDNSTGTIADRYWDFGDGTVTNATEIYVPYVYASAGTFTVKLIVSGPAGISTNTKANLISVTQSASTTTNITGETSDRSIGLNAAGTPALISNAAATTLRAGDDNAAYNQSNGCGVVVFRLPDLQGKAITTANLDFDWRLANENSTRLPISLHLYGVRFSSSSAVLTGDYGFMDITSSSDVLIQPNLVTKTATNADPLAPAETDASGDAALAAWLSAQYTAGAQPGNYVFLRFHATGPSANGWEIGSGDNADVSLRPVLSITTGGNQELSSDDDSDGLPNDWETQYFGGATNANPDVLAANGINTIRETYVAGLNPTNAQSVFSVSNDWNILRWNAASGRVYSVYGATNLLSGFQPLETNIVWPQNSWTGQVSTSQEEFYKIEVRLAP